MKKHTSSILTLSLMIVIGVFVGRTFLTHPMVQTSDSNDLNLTGSNGTAVIDTMESIIVAPDIKIYSEAAVAIVIGTVEKIENNFANISISEVLKGDAQIKSISVSIPDSQVEDSTVLGQGEYGLFFVCKNTVGDYLVCAGNAGKVLIDKDGNLKGASAFVMPLIELKTKISEVLSVSTTK